MICRASGARGIGTGYQGLAPLATHQTPLRGYNRGLPRVDVMRTPRILLLLAALAAVSAGPPADSPDDLVRQGNDAFDRGDFDSADRLYAAAAERTPDPGLVAFN